MKRILLPIALALTLPGCATTGLGSIGSAPLEQTTADEKGLSAAWAGLGATAAAVEQLTILGKIKKGTPTGDLFKKLMLDAEAALDAATAAKNLLSRDAAMADAKVAFDQLTRLFRGI